MIRFVTRQNSFKDVRNKLLFVLVPIFSILFVAVLWTLSGAVQGSANYILIVTIAVIFVFAIYNSIRGQKKIHESFTLTVDEDGFLREQHGAQAIRILRSEVTSITRSSKGSIVIIGASRLSPILIPEQIDDRDNLEMILNTVKPIEQGKASVWAIPVIMVCGLIVLVTLFFGVDNRIISGISGTLLLAFFAASLVLVFRSKNLDSRVRRMSFIGVIPLLSLGAMVYFKVFPSGQPGGAPLLKESYFVSVVTIYFLDDAQAIEESSFKNMIHDKLPSFTLVKDFPEKIESNQYILDIPEDIRIAYPPADAEYLSMSGEALSKEEVEQLQTVRKGVFMQFIGPSDSVQENQRRIAAFIAGLAKERSLIILDENSRSYFNEASWKLLRVDQLEVSPMDLTSQINIHSYREGEFCRAVTLGMDKFSLPDISIKDFTCSDQVTIGRLINAIVQTLFENPEISGDSLLRIDISGLKNANVRFLLIDFDDRTEHMAKIKLKSIEPEDGDGNNRQITIDFSSMSDGSLQEAQFALIKELFGRPDSLVSVEHDDLLLDASNRARQRLPDLKRLHNGGLEPGFSIWLKAPFTTSDGDREWMWVEVVGWEEKSIKGILQNDPYDVPDLAAGAEVKVNEDDIFDYILYKPDGSFEGNETEQYLR